VSSKGATVSSAAVSQHPDLASLVVPSTGTYLQKYTREGGRTLEVGCGPGQYRMAVNGAYVGVDVTAEAYNEEIPRAVDVLADGNSLPFADDAFDLVFFSNVFYSLTNAPRVLNETIRVTKSGGLMTVFDYSKRALEDLKRRTPDEEFRSATHVRSVAEWKSLLQQSGLRQISVAFNTSDVRAKLAEALLPRGTYGTLVDRVISRIVVEARVL